MRELDTELMSQAGELGIEVKGNWGNKRLKQAIKEAAKKSEPVKNNDQPTDKFQTIEWANERAAKIWEGQSVSLSLVERIGRIRMALKAKGFRDFDNLVIPTDEEYQKYL